jgi:hypothetical protein
MTRGVTKMMMATASVLACATPQETQLRNVQMMHVAAQKARLRSVLILGLTPNETWRRAFESDMAAKLKKRGTHAVISFAALPGGKPPGDKDQLREALRQAGVDGVLVAQLVGKDTRKKVVGMETVGGQAMFGGFMVGSPGLYGFYSAAYPGYSEPVVEAETVVTAQFKLFRTDGEGALLWSAQSETVDPGKANEVIAQVDDAVAAELARDGYVTG